MKVMKSIVISLNQGYFGLHYMKKPFKNYEWLETFKVVFGPAIFACACCIKKLSDLAKNGGFFSFELCKIQS